jgi:hypothetical protein
MRRPKPPGAVGSGRNYLADWADTAVPRNAGALLVRRCAGEFQNPKSGTARNHSDPDDSSCGNPKASRRPGSGGILPTRRDLVGHLGRSRPRYPIRPTNHQGAGWQAGAQGIAATRNMTPIPDFCTFGAGALMRSRSTRPPNVYPILTEIPDLRFRLP